jgi:S1-C subfamily serine protease
MDLDKFRDRCARAFGNTAPSSVLDRVRAIVGSDSAMPATEEGRLAVEAYRTLMAGGEPTPMGLSALQFLIRLTRPAPLVHKGKPDALQRDHVDTFPTWKAFQDAVGCLPLVGRIDRASPTLATAESIGSGMLLTADLLLTNRHVVNVLSRGTDRLQEGQAVVRFAFEDDSFAPDAPVPVLNVEAMHETLDMALLRLKSGSGLPGSTAFAPLDATPLGANTDVVVVGYPMNDKERNPLFIGNIFGTEFGVLRASPGQCTRTFENGFYHDCSTLGGNSGSPVLSLDGARLVGLHTGGGFLWKNAAVSAGAIKQFVDNVPH